MDNVFAYTEESANFPGYLSVNKVPGGLSFTARTPGFNGIQCGAVIVPNVEMPELIAALKRYYYGAD